MITNLYSCGVLFEKKYCIIDLYVYNDLIKSKFKSIAKLILLLTESQTLQFENKGKETLYLQPLRTPADSERNYIDLNKKNSGMKIEKVVS